MQQITVPPTATAHIGAIAYVEFGQAFGLPRLIGKGRIAEEKTRQGIPYVRLEPVEGLRLDKWVPVNQIIGFDWTQPTLITLESNTAA